MACNNNWGYPPNYPSNNYPGSCGPSPGGCGPSGSCGPNSCNNWNCPNPSCPRASKSPMTCTSPMQSMAMMNSMSQFNPRACQSPSPMRGGMMGTMPPPMGGNSMQYSQMPQGPQPNWGGNQFGQSMSSPGQPGPGQNFAPGRQMMSPNGPMMPMM